MMHLIFAFWDQDETLSSEKKCAGMELNTENIGDKKDPWEGTSFKNLEDCE